MESTCFGAEKSLTSKKARETTPYEKQLFKNYLGLEINQIHEPVGCTECSAGYKGRIALQEVLLISPNIRDAINAKISKSELRNLVYKDDVITLLQDGLYKVIAGLTSTDEVIKLVEADDEVNAETRVKHMFNKSNQQY